MSLQSDLRNLMGGVTGRNDYRCFLPTVNRIGAVIRPYPGVPRNGAILVSYLGSNGIGPNVSRRHSLNFEANNRAASMSLGVAEAVVSIAMPVTARSSSTSPPKIVVDPIFWTKKDPFLR